MRICAISYFPIYGCELRPEDLEIKSDYERHGHLYVLLYVPHFVARNPCGASAVGGPIENERTIGTSYDAVRAFLRLFKQTRIELVCVTKGLRNLGLTSVAYVVATMPKRLLGLKIRLVSRFTNNPGFIV